MKSHLISFRLLMALAFGCVFSFSFAQSAERKVTFQNFVMEENYKEFVSGKMGIRLKFDLHFSWAEGSSTYHAFTVSYRGEQNGKTVLQSGTAQLSSVNVTASVQSGGNSMLGQFGSIFIPYSAIPLEGGFQTINMSFTVSNKAGTYTDCFQRPISFENRRIVMHSINEQVFTFEDVKVDFAAKDFTSSIRGMEIKAKVWSKYKLEECTDQTYNFITLIRAADGKVLYDSRKEGQGHKPTAGLSLNETNGRTGGTLNAFVDYYSLNMEATGEAEVVFLLQGTEGGPKQVFAQKMTLEVPPKYNFEEQGFSASNVSVRSGKRDGVQGVLVDFDCKFTHYGTLRNPIKGQYYFFAVLMDDAGKIVIGPERAPGPNASTTHLMDGFLPELKPTPVKVGLFIPFSMLKLTEGSHHLKYALMVSDVNLGTKFPQIEAGSVEIVKPKELQFLVSVERIEMQSGDYDTEIFAISKGWPELQYAICVGNDHYYESEYIKNSLSAVPGSCTLRVSDGDPINLELYDVDSGFFNASDKLGSWDIQYAGKGSPFNFELDHSGQVNYMRVKIERK